MDIHPSKDSHTCKMEYEDDSVSDIARHVKYSTQKLTSYIDTSIVEQA